MKQPLVHPKSGDQDKELQQLIEFYNETLGFCPNSIKTIVTASIIGFSQYPIDAAWVEKPPVERVAKA